METHVSEVVSYVSEEQDHKVLYFSFNRVNSITDIFNEQVVFIQ